MNAADFIVINFFFNDSYLSLLIAMSTEKPSEMMKDWARLRVKMYLTK